MKGIVKNITFYRSHLTEEEKIIKIQRSFNCDHLKAKEILKAVDTEVEVEVDDFSYNTAIAFGVDCKFLTHEQKIFTEELERKKEKDKQELEIKKENAESWFKNLQPQEQEYVKILGYFKFHTSAVG